MKIKGYDLAHEWALQVHNPQGAVFDLARFRNIQVAASIIRPPGRRST